MAKGIQSIRGMHDVLPGQSATWQWLEAQIQTVLQAYGYQEIRMPLVEMTQLFTRSIGEVTDIVEKEMYTFEDRNGDSLSLRPEGTASCVRACLQHGLLHNQQQKLWYQGPMFRHERPQKGRYRQFHQVGVETYGFAGPDVDAELIFIGYRLWQQLGLQGIRLEINTLGDAESRTAHREALIAYLEQFQAQLDEDAQRRLHTNPLRILDTKNPELQAIVNAAPSLESYLSEDAKAHFANLKQRLDAAGITYTVNPRLVRGLDYYSRTVFEWITDDLGAQGTVCAGGRYDSLVEQLGGRATPAIGFAMGVERLLALLEAQDVLPSVKAPLIYLMAMGEAAEQKVQLLAEELRNAFPEQIILVNMGGGGFKAQMKRADRSQALYAGILGDDEMASASISLKPLRDEQAQQRLIAWADLPQTLAE